MEKFVKIWGALIMVTAVIIGVHFIFSVVASNADGAEIKAETRILNLPQDEGKWFVSVVGDPSDQQYVNLLAWFDRNLALSELKAGVHFHGISTKSVAFRSRYAKNVNEFPTIRVQKPDGFVIYEAAGDSIPSSAEGLSYEIAGASNMAGWQILRRPIFDGRIFPIFHRPFMPWRQRMERERNKCPDGNCPQPGPPVDIEVDIDIGPEPEPEPVAPSGVSVPAAIGLCLFCFLMGGGAGVAVQWRKLYDSEG